MNISSDDLIFYKDGNKIYSGGFSVNSVLLKKGHSPFITFNNNHNTQKGGSYLENEELEKNGNSNNVSDLFKNFVVPSGLLYYPNKQNYNYENDNQADNLDTINYDDDSSTDEYISDDLHERLLNLASKDNKNLAKGGSKKKRRVGNKSTKKNRKG